MSVITNLLSLAQSNYGWLAVICWGCYQLYAPLYLNRDTVLAPIVDQVPEKVDDLANEQERLREDVDDIQKQNQIAMQVQRAQARANDSMDEDRVDEYLLANGVRPNEFLTDPDDEGFHDTE